MQQSTDNRKFAARFEALIAEEDPTGQASRAFDGIKEDVQAIRESRGDAYKAELTAMRAEAARLKEAGDVNSEAAKEWVRRMRSRTAGIRRPLEKDLILNAYTKTVAEAQARSEPLPFDPEVIEFLRQVAKGMKERGELE